MEFEGAEIEKVAAFAVTKSLEVAGFNLNQSSVPFHLFRCSGIRLMIMSDFT
jgi:hypothetical protein